MVYLTILQYFKWDNSEDIYISMWQPGLYSTNAPGSSNLRLTCIFEYISMES